MPLFDSLLSIVAPHICVMCGSEGSLLCRWCAPDAFPHLPSRCYRCKKTTQDSATCQTCRRKTPIKQVWVVTDYDGAAKRLLHLYKFERARGAAVIIGQAMVNRLPYLPPHTVIVPVPTATMRMRQRGYDHTALLARAFPRYQLSWSAAVTRLTQSRQVGSNRQQRKSQLQDAFMVTKPAVIKDAHVLIIDDVLTTGATLEAVAAKLKQAGAESINAAVFTQKY